MNIDRSNLLRTVAVGSLTTFVGAYLPGRAIAATPADRITLRLGAMPVDGSGEAFYASDLGFFDEAGLNVELTVLQGGAALLAALAAKDLDIGFASPGNLINARESGIKMRFVCPAGVVVPDPRHVVVGLLVAKDSAFRTVSDLGGQTVGVNGIKDITQFSVQALMDREHMAAASVQFVEMPYSEMIAALERGRVAAIAQPEPYLTASRKSGARLLASLDTVQGKRYLLAGWIINDDWPSNNIEALRRFVGAMRRTAQWANSHHSESAAILIKYTRLDPDLAATMTRARFDESGTVDPSLLRGPLDLLEKYGNISHLTPADLITPADFVGTLG